MAQLAACTKRAVTPVQSETGDMQAYTSPVPAYLLSALLPHLLSICTPHLWARTLLSLSRSSATQWGGREGEGC